MQTRGFLGEAPDLKFAKRGLQSTIFCRHERYLFCSVNLSYVQDPAAGSV